MKEGEQFSLLSEFEKAETEKLTQAEGANTGLPEAAPKRPFADLAETLSRQMEADKARGAREAAKKEELTDAYWKKLEASSKKNKPEAKEGKSSQPLKASGRNPRASRTERRNPLTEVEVPSAPISAKEKNKSEAWIDLCQAHDQS